MFPYIVIFHILIAFIANNFHGGGMAWKEKIIFRAFRWATTFWDHWTLFVSSLLVQLFRELPLYLKIGLCEWTAYNIFCHMLKITPSKCLNKQNAVSRREYLWWNELKVDKENTRNVSKNKIRKLIKKICTKIDGRSLNH